MLINICRSDFLEIRTH